MKSKFVDVTPIIAGLKEMSGGTTYDALEYERRSLYSLVADMLESAPTADVAPVRRAHWKEFNSCAAECSKCGGTISNERLWKKRYCPECGAKMDA